MDPIVLTSQTVFHPEGDPVRPQGCEKPAGRRVNEFLSGGLGMVDYLVQVLLQNLSVLHETFNFLGDKQMYLFTRIHLFLGSATDLSGQSLLEMTPILVTIEKIYRFADILSRMISQYWVI
jgi:hypothetical protein